MLILICTSSTWTFIKKWHEVCIQRFYSTALTFFTQIISALTFYICKPLKHNETSKEITCQCELRCLIWIVYYDESVNIYCTKQSGSLPPPPFSLSLSEWSRQLPVLTMKSGSLSSAKCGQMKFGKKPVNQDILA